MMNLNAHNEYLTRKLAHYNKWLLDDEREFGKPYPGFPEDMKGKKVQSAVLSDMVSTLVGTKAVPASPVKAVKVKASRKESGPKAGTKSQLAVEIFKRLNGDKAAVIAAIQAELGMSVAGATTYFYNAKKAV